MQKWCIIKNRKGVSRLAVNQEVRKIAEIIRQSIPAEQIYLFGSHAYGKPHKHSDYDIYVIIPDDSLRPIEAMQQAQRAIYPLRLNVPVDVMATTRSDFNQMKNLITLERTVNQRGILL